MMEMTRTDPEWKDKIITGDETWVYGYDPETKPQSAEWRDIAPNDFFLFPKLKAVLKGRHFDTRDDIIEKSPLALKSIPKEAYKNCFDNWEKRWRCTANLFNFECQTFEAIIADTSLDSPEKIQMATKGLILTLVQEAELLLKDAFKGASLGRPNPTANVPIPSTSFASVVAEKDKPVKPAPPKPKAKSTFVNLAPSFESHVVVRVDREVRDDEICENFRSNHSVQSLLEKREIRVVHRSNNAAHSTSTVFIEVDNQVAEILGQHGRIPVAGLVHRPLRVLQVNAKKSPTVILEIANLANSTQADIVLLQELSTNFFWPTHTAITSIAICLEQSIIMVHSAYWHGLRAADDFIPLLEDTIRRASLPVILGMDTNAHSPTWGIGARLDFRGANLEEFASFNDLHFLGPPVDSTWLNGPLSSSIDVTLASSSLAIHATRDMVNNETNSSWVESSCKEQTFKSFLNSSLHQRCGDFTMEQKLKQRICIEFCVKLQISATETFEMLNKAFPNNAPKRTTVFEWHSRFKAGRISIEDDPRQGRPTFQRTDENVQKIPDLIKENPRTTLLELEQDTGISKTTIGRIVTEDLRLKKTPAKFIPRFLTNEQKLCRLATCEDMLEMTRTDPEWKDKIITGDETWVYGYDPETKRQSAEWRGQGEPRLKKSRILKSRNKVLLVAFLDNKGIVHHEYLPAGQTVIKEMYLSILRRLREAIRKKKARKMD
ncbi:hypothetical protein LAZ67_X001016 [Cordylochernes scorpioides]|uniref:Transposase n=1 Tax=Cordylochernes scorpioides TaxID=51811 RepID=A0ABY6LS37_9ARAC|nr:hypothetical protein LAZ67_X001016 [Cordylochernes scorpioides]